MGKTITADTIRIEQLPDDANIPLELLLMADPNQEMVLSYIPYCILLAARYQGEIVGILAMSPETKEKAEVRNVAVAPAFRRRGIARQLLTEACSRASRLGYTVLQVCTSNASVDQLKLYQQFGFELTDVHWNYFTEQYPEPIIENGILCRHRMVLSRLL